MCLKVKQERKCVLTEKEYCDLFTKCSSDGQIYKQLDREKYSYSDIKRDRFIDLYLDIKRERDRRTYGDRERKRMRQKETDTHIKKQKRESNVKKEYQVSQKDRRIE